MKNLNYPRPFQPVRGSKSGKPIMALFDLLGRSWTMGILWHLSQKPSRFRELQSLCETISPTTLNKRIKELTDAALITRTMLGYDLTAHGIELSKLLYPLHNWAEGWADNFEKTH